MTHAPTRRLLSLTPLGPHGSRSRMTCHYRCGNACDQPVANQTETGHIRDEIIRAVERRSVLRGAAVGAGALMVGGIAGQATPAAAVQSAGQRATSDLGRSRFTPVAPNKRDAVVVAEGFRHDVLVRWGDPVLPGAPRFDAHRQTVQAAAAQFGYNNDYVGLVPLRDDPDAALLVVNHEYTDEQLMYPTGLYDEDTVKRLSMAYHGLSVVKIRRGRTPGSWLRVKPHRSEHNRRLNHETPYRIDGPAAGDPRMRTTADPSGATVLGTFGNCAGGTTPWGTVLSGEENFNGYFDKSGELDPRYAASYARYGINGTGRGWADVDPRFDLTAEPHEPFRFGWIVEVDPLHPKSTPRKLSMLGRFKHEGANVAIAPDGRAVVYMGDDERGDYMYKFVSRDKIADGNGRAARKHNMTLLSHGTLFVARFTGDGTEDGRYDGTGTWLPLTSDTTSYVDGMSVADVLIDTRLAADRLSPTRMDRPEDVEPNPVNGKVYAALTNNSQRGTTFPVDEPNPLATSNTRSRLGAPLTPASGNRNGYVLEITPTGGHASRKFTWDLMLVCGAPEAQETYFAGFDKSKVSPISCPDNVAFDDEGNLWISTDGNVLGSNDGVFRVPVRGADRGRVQQFLTVPRGAEACGPLLADGSRSLFFAVQHPGEIDGATFESPASTWPHTDDFPRPSVCVAYRAR
jgi:hypothetical protein